MGGGGAVIRAVLRYLMDTASPSAVRVNQVPVRFTDEELAALDRGRGDKTRSEFIRAAVIAVAARP